MPTLTFAYLAHIVLPAGYVALCIWMHQRRAWWFTYFAYFFVFGSFGGWLLMLEVVSLGGVPITALSAIAIEFFLLTAAAIACFVSSLVLQFRKNKGLFERGAMLGGYAYLILHSAFISMLLRSK